MPGENRAATSPACYVADSERVVRVPRVGECEDKLFAWLPREG